MEILAHEIVADRSGALYLPGERVLVVADLHLEKGSAFATRGWLLPPYDTCETLERLSAVVQRYGPRAIVALGDSFHDLGAEARLGEDACSRLRDLQRGREWAWITGNHDPQISARLGGSVLDEVNLAGLALRHEPKPGPVNGEIAGHLHPAARVALTGTSLRAPCFVGNRNRLVLPAFGAFTGGLNVLDAAFEPLFADSPFEVHLIGRDGVYPVARASLAPD